VLGEVGEGNGVLIRTTNELIIHQKFQFPLLLLTWLRRRKKTREEKNAKVQRRQGAKKKEEKEREKREKEKKSQFPIQVPLPVSFFSLAALRLCGGFAPLHLCVKFPMVLSVFSPTSAGLLSYRPSVRVRCGIVPSEASDPIRLLIRSQQR